MRSSTARIQDSEYNGKDILVLGLALPGGVLVLDCALIMDRLLTLFEPIRGSWVIEIASYALVIAVSVVISQEAAKKKFRKSAVLGERADSMERLSEMQQGYFAVLRQEMEGTRAAWHDMEINRINQINQIFIEMLLKLDNIL